MSNMASASIGDELHLVYLSDGGDLYHRTRRANGEWTPWGQIRGTQLLDVTCAGVGDELHVTAINGAGVWFHTIRWANGQWQDIIQLPDQPLLND
jgi:hypothetical protein